MGKIIAIVNQKGNVGKTTTSIHIAKSLARRKKNVLLIDLDPLSNMSNRLDITIADANLLLKCLNGETSIKDCIHKIDDQFSWLPGGSNLISFEISAIYKIDREQVLISKLSSVCDSYDFVVIDTPSSLGLLTMNALVASDFIVVPVRCDYFANEGIAELLRTINDVSSSVNGKLRILGFFITHVNTKLRSCSKNMDDIKTCFDNMLFNSCVYEDNQLDRYYNRLTEEIISCL